MNRDKNLIVVAVVLLVIAGALFVNHFVKNQNQLAVPPSKADIEKQIAEIQNNPHMPDVAKAAAIGQINSRAADSESHPTPH